MFSTCKASRVPRGVFWGYKVSSSDILPLQEEPALVLAALRKRNTDDMNNTRISILVVVLSLLLAALTDARSLPDVKNRVKRQSADVQAAEYLAWIALGGKIPYNGCARIACGVVDIVNRIRRSSSDQRIAELQALMALVQSGGMVAHGQYDPLSIGKRKRSGFRPEIQSADDERRWALVNAIVQKEASDISRENEQ